jgi:hypothetical protein
VVIPPFSDSSHSSRSEVTASPARPFRRRAAFAAAAEFFCAGRGLSVGRLETCLVGRFTERSVSRSLVEPAALVAFRREPLIARGSPRVSAARAVVSVPICSFRDRTLASIESMIAWVVLMLVDRTRRTGTSLLRVRCGHTAAAPEALTREVRQMPAVPEASARLLAGSTALVVTLLLDLASHANGSRGRRMEARACARPGDERMGNREWLG